MDIWSYMLGYDRELNEDEFDARLWEAMHDETFELGEQFEDFCNAYGFNDIHSFLRVIRYKKEKGKI